MKYQYYLESWQRWLSEQGLTIPKWPERLEIVESLPMTRSGKVQKFRLRELLADKIDSKVLTKK